MLHRKTVYDFMKVICPINCNVFWEDRDFLTDILRFCFISYKAVKLIYSKTWSLRKHYFRELSFRKKIGSTSEYESKKYNNTKFSSNDNEFKILNSEMDSNSINDLNDLQPTTCFSTDYNEDVEGEGKKKGKQRPNYFIAIQITDVEVLRSVQQIQEHILIQNKDLRKSMIAVNTLHITLMVMYLKDSDDHSKALKALNAIHQEYNSIMCKEFLKLEFYGLGHFGNRVLYVKLKENSHKQLCALAESVRKHFKDVGIYTTDTRKEINPHLTVAKLTYSKQPSKRIKRIPPSFYEKFLDMSFGCDIVKSIQLLKMNGPKTSTGYYTGDELFFKLQDPVVCKKLNLLMAISEKKKGIKNSISRLARRLFF